MSDDTCTNCGARTKTYEMPAKAQIEGETGITTLRHCSACGATKLLNTKYRPINDDVVYPSTRSDGTSGTNIKCPTCHSTKTHVELTASQGTHYDSSGQLPDHPTERPPLDTATLVCKQKAGYNTGQMDCPSPRTTIMFSPGEDISHMFPGAKVRSTFRDLAGRKSLTSEQMEARDTKEREENLSSSKKDRKNYKKTIKDLNASAQKSAAEKRKATPTGRFEALKNAIKSQEPAKEESEDEES